MDEKLVRKIEKLLKLGNGSSYKGEADTALKMAYELMRENDISMADIGKVSRDEKLGELGKTKMSEKDKQWRKWELNLIASLARLFDCQVLRTKYDVSWDRKVKLSLIGRESNRITCKLMFDWIHEKTMKEAKYLDPYHASSRTAYCVGVASSIRRKVNDIKATAPKTDGWGIVPIDEVSQWLKDNMGKLETTDITTSKVRDAIAYEAGRVVGREMSLNRQFGLTGIEAK